MDMWHLYRLDSNIFSPEVVFGFFRDLVSSLSCAHVAEGAAPAQRFSKSLGPNFLRQGAEGDFEHKKIIVSLKDFMLI